MKIIVNNNKTNQTKMFHKHEKCAAKGGGRNLSCSMQRWKNFFTMSVCF